MGIEYKRPAGAPTYLTGTDRTVVGVDYIPEITKEVIDKQILSRYFARRSNDPAGEIVEIDKKKYTTLQNVSLYITVMVPWRIAGPVNNFLVGGTTYVGTMTANRIAIKNAEEKMPGIGKKLIDPMQYYQAG